MRYSCGAAALLETRMLCGATPSGECSAMPLFDAAFGGAMRACGQGCSTAQPYCGDVCNAMHGSAAGQVGARGELLVASLGTWTGPICNVDAMPCRLCLNVSQSAHSDQSSAWTSSIAERSLTRQAQIRCSSEQVTGSHCAFYCVQGFGTIWGKVGREQLTPCRARQGKHENNTHKHIIARRIPRVRSIVCSTVCSSLLK